MIGFGTFYSCVGSSVEDDVGGRVAHHVAYLVCFGEVHGGSVAADYFASAGEVICRDRTTVNLAEADKVRDMVCNTAPDIILNAAAYTAVERAESDHELAM